MKIFLSVAMLFGMLTLSQSAEAAQCTVDLENGRGVTVDTFRGYGYDRYDACREARQDCRRAIRSGYYRARILNCVERTRHNRPGRGGRIVHQSCTSNLVGPRGHRTIQTFIGHASGPRGTGVKAQACQRALRQCQAFQARTGRYRAQCQVERHIGIGGIF